MKLPNTPTAILQATTEVWGVSPTAFGRTSQVTQARQTAVMLMRAAEEQYSLPEIGRFMHRDHTTVMWSVRRGKERMRDARFAAMVRRVVQKAREMGARVPENWEE